MEFHVFFSRYLLDFKQLAPEEQRRFLAQKLDIHFINDGESVDSTDTVVVEKSECHFFID